jgi:Cu(I)/Ag(I) efflux system membrane fusion protein
MRKSLPGLLLVAAAFVAGYGYGRWYAQSPVVSAKTTRPVLYYRCPMHPSFRSDKPGVAPCCQMALEPVYADDAAQPAAGINKDAIHITPKQQQLIGVQYGQVEYGSVSRITHAPARVGVNENRVARIQTKLEGYVDHISVTAPGEYVTQGQPLFSIYNRRAYTMPQMAFLQAQMDAAGMGRTQTNARAAAEAVETARMQLEMTGFTDYQIDGIARAHQALTSFPFHSPLTGVIMEYNVALNQKVGMEPLLTIADLTTVWVTGSFAPADAAAIKPGESATLTVPYLPEKVFHGTVQTLLPEVDAASRTTKVRFQFDNAAFLLKPEMFGELELRSPAEKKLTVPREAVLDRGRSQSVFLDLGGGYVEPREVKTGETFGDRIQIRDGLKPGERIVVSGNFLLDSEVRMRSRTSW